MRISTVKISTVKISMFVLCASLVLPAAAWADVSEEVNYSFDVDAGARFRLANVNGDVFVSGWDQSTIDVRAVKSADDDDDLQRVEIIVDSSSEEVRIETKHHKAPGSGWFGRSNDSGEVEYHVRAPRSVIMRLVETVNGNVEIEGMRAGVRAETVNGDVHTRDLSADVKLETVNGDIKATFEHFGSGQEGSFETVNGGITVYLPQDTNARVTADTVNGSIKNDFGLKVDKGFITRELRGQLGSGDGRLSFDTVNGSINIRAQ